jgi:CheY-like chemotaxis protein
MCERVFERFVQGEHQRDSKTHGTGLGLSICRQLAQLMGGDAGGSSIHGQGSTFWFTASLARPMRDTLQPPQAPTSVQDWQRTLAGCRVLIVDDDDAIRDAMCRLLKGHGMHVDTAANAMDALQQLHMHSYDVLLADVRMPEMSGLELTETVRQKMQSPIKIIGISAGALDNDREACLEAGMNEHISKPFKVKDLLETIQNTL